MGEATEVRVVPAAEGGRIESGPTQFGDDWPGVFIRGDNAIGFYLDLKGLLDQFYERGGKGFFSLRRLEDLLLSAAIRNHPPHTPPEPTP